jgi:hypothetical protein
MSCDRCGFDKYVDTPIHNGQWVRRDCARCKRTIGFPVWYGRATEPTPTQNSRKNLHGGGNSQQAGGPQKNAPPPPVERLLF